MEHTPKPLPTGYKGIPFIIGKGGLPGVCSRGVLSFSWIVANLRLHQCLGVTAHFEKTNPTPPIDESPNHSVYILLNNKVYVVSFQQKSIGGLKSVGLYPHKTLGVFKHAFFKTIGVFRSLGVLNLRICCGEFFWGRGRRPLRLPPPARAFQL